jgi:RNA polymerase sigma-70 factor, ECF subfamily
MSRLPPDVLAGSTDEALLLRWRQGESDAGEQLFDRHYEAVRRFFRNKVPASVSRDLVQKTFLACLESFARFQYHSTFRTYLLGIARHVLIDYLRATPKRDGRELDLAEVVLADVQPAGEDAIAAKRERRLLLRALRRLRFPLQLVLELRYWEAMSDAEIAEVLDEPLGTIKTRLRAGRLALEDQLTRLAGTTEELRSTLDSLHLWAARVRLAATATPTPSVSPPDPHDERIGVDDLLTRDSADSADPP